jgi:hypothetical protein
MIAHACPSGPSSHLALSIGGFQFPGELGDM